jgi:hypothetical protein
LLRATEGGFRAAQTKIRPAQCASADIPSPHCLMLSQNVVTLAPIVEADPAAVPDFEPLPAAVPAAEVSELPTDPVVLSELQRCRI